MRYFDVRVRIPQNKMGEFVGDILPRWAEVVGFDKLENEGNGADYKPEPGSIIEAVYKKLTRPYKAMELAHSMKAKDKAVLSALYNLKAKGLVHKNGDGTYARS